jgi:hypothetical protein
MGKADWSLDHLERDLAAGFVLLDRAERSGRLGSGETGALAEGVLQCMNGALMKVSESLEAQSRMRRELAFARDEFQRTQTLQAERIQSLEAEVTALRRNLEEERRRARFESLRLSPGQAPQVPADDYLNRPLVLRSQQGEFLGVTDRAGQALSLSGFQNLVEGAWGSGPRGDRVVASCWEACAGSWFLTLCFTGRTYSRKCYILETNALRTPSGNKVTLLSNIHVDGVPVPQGYVVQMFRHLRESFQEE